jgi:hypothetical protein
MAIKSLSIPRYSKAYPQFVIFGMKQYIWQPGKSLHSRLFAIDFSYFCLPLFSDLMYSTKKDKQEKEKNDGSVQLGA